jgi:hypothetical protein
MLALLALLAATAEPSVDLKSCTRESLLLTARATAGLPVGVPELDPPRLTLHDTDAERAVAVDAWRKRVKAASEMVLAACSKEPHFVAPKPEPAKPEDQR